MGSTRRLLPVLRPFQRACPGQKSFRVRHRTERFPLSPDRTLRPYRYRIRLLLPTFSASGSSINIKNGPRLIKTPESRNYSRAEWSSETEASLLELDWSQRDLLE